jgi:hypothetical protein
MEVLRVEVFLGPLVVCREKSSGLDRGLHFDGLRRSKPRALFSFCSAIQKVEMVHQCERLNREDCCNVGVANGQQVVPVVLLPLCVRSLDNNEELPLWLQAINHIDCREGDAKKLLAAADHLLKVVATSPR